MDHFELFEIEKDLLVDKTALKKKYYQLIKKYHPDHAIHLSEDEQIVHRNLAMQTNKAYKILLDQTSRIEYLLEISGHKIEEGGNKLPADFLMQMMEINELLMDAKMEGKEEDIHKAKDHILQFQSELSDQLSQINDAFSEGKVTEKEYSALKNYILKGRYLKRLLSQL